MPAESIHPTATHVGAAVVGNTSCAMPGKVELSPFAFPRPTDAVVKNAKIMIVDDERTITKVLRKYLQQVGFRNFELLSDPDVVVTRIIASSPDIVLLDICMGPVSGLEILQRLRAIEQTQFIPVVMITGATDEDTRIRALNLGANDFLGKPVVVSELVSRVRNTLSAKVYRDQVMEYSLQLESDVLSDALTGIANRRAFDYELKRRFTEWNRQRTPLGLLMADIDHFKMINDRHGHGVGDLVLRNVAQELRDSMREMDLVARYGGEEFAIIFPATTALESKQAAKRAHSVIVAKRFSVEDHQIQLTVSFGVASVMNGDDAELLVCRADAALYAAKQHGRNCCYFHDGESCVPLGTSSHNTVASSPLEPRLSRHADTNVHEARIAIVDDDPLTVEVAQEYLKDAGFRNLVPFHDTVEARDAIKREEPDIVLLGICMPQLSGFDILKDMRMENRAKPIPVLVFTTPKDMQTKVEALNLGASDFLQKPLDPCELVARVHNTLLAKAHVDMLVDYSARLEYEARLRASELTASRR